MKTLILSLLVSTLVVTAKADERDYSPGVADVVKLSQADIKSDVVEKFVESAPGGYQLRANDILYLKQQGVDDKVIVAMLKRSRNNGSSVVSPTPTVANSQVTSNMLAPANPGTIAPSYPAPTVASDYVSAPSQVYIYPSQAPTTYYYTSLVDPYYPNYGFGFSYYPSYRSSFGFGFNSYPYRYSAYHYNSYPYRNSYYPYRSSFSGYDNSFHGGFSTYGHSRGSVNFSSGGRFSGSGSFGHGGRGR